MLVQDCHIASDISTVRSIFKGPESSPFLAPRGVWLVKNKLFVSDTGRNRVFVWNELPEHEFAVPSHVLGQGEVDGTGRNRNDTVSASSLQYPSALWSDGTRLIVADAWNHRVLIWHELNDLTGQPADVVIGQPDFTTNEPNVTGLASPPSAQSLYWPYGVHSDGKQLWIADTGNRRVLYFPEIPTENFAPAEAVIGKPDFESRDFESQEPIWPYSVRVNAQGNLVITDTQCFRALVWKDWQQAIGSVPADIVVGQPDLAGAGQNQFFPTPVEKSLNWCYDSFFYKEGLMVLDTANSRVKWHKSLPTEHNPAPDALIGPPDAFTPSENVNNIKGTDYALYWPFALCIEKNCLAIADTGNHRVIINDLKI